MRTALQSKYDRPRMAGPRIIVRDEQVALRGELFDIGLVGAEVSLLHRLLIDGKGLESRNGEDEVADLAKAVDAYQELLCTMGLRVTHRAPDDRLTAMSPPYLLRNIWVPIGEVGMVGGFLASAAAELLRSVGYRSYLPSGPENGGSVAWCQWERWSGQR